ncbi:uroplakin-3b-like isoform X2 [Polypterus senegalus]|uniref:uroplakin-3b-like isoform X2 n=1 Tax=Polypterus senegalus TaxID=55291 RepID=UPI001966AA53|nr:uroplakin-3b-like isoform X2 [Polypterus senegalus]
MHSISHMDLFVWTLLALLSVGLVTAQISTSAHIPEVTGSNVAGRITATTFTLAQPVCFFDFQSLGCTSTCEVWLVVAKNAAERNLYDSEKTTQSVTMMTSNLDIFYVGNQSAYACPQTNNGQRVVKVGHNVDCVSNTCNGPLPIGSTVNVKYFVVNPIINNVVSETPWSSNINLLSPKDPATIDTWFGKRSAGMVVITAILSTLTAILLLLLLIMFCSTLTEDQNLTKNPINQDPYKIKRYDTHHVRSSTYENKLYQ